jgi:cytochrome c peroxidase
LLVVRAIAGQGNGATEAVPQRLSYEHGEQLFFNETFEGNGRTCGTCHVARAEFTISPELVRERYDLDPDDPLFRTIDSDDGEGRDFTTMLAHAVFRVTIPLHANVVAVDEPERRTIQVWRGVPSISNVALTAPYLQDGRAARLQDQARGAILDHFEPRRRPRPRELDALALFMSEIYYPLRLRALDDAPASALPAPGFSVPVESPAALRGKEAFDLRCRRCHGGELSHAPPDPATSRFADVFVSDTNVPGFPLLRLGFKQPDGSVVVAVTPDPGRAAISGDLLDLNTFDTPPLRGVKHTAPYFHDNSAMTLREVVDHYNDRFQFHMTLQEEDDLISYLELL